MRRKFPNADSREPKLRHHNETERLTTARGSSKKPGTWGTGDVRYNTRYHAQAKYQLFIYIYTHARAQCIITIVTINIIVIIIIITVVDTTARHFAKSKCNARHEIKSKGAFRIVQFEYKVKMSRHQ